MGFGFRSCDDDEFGRTDFNGPHETGGSIQSQGVSVEVDIDNIIETEISERRARMLDHAMTALVLGLAAGGFGWTGYQWFAHSQPGTSHAVYCLFKSYPVLAVTFGYLLADLRTFQEWLSRHPRMRWLAIGGIAHCVWPIWPW